MKIVVVAMVVVGGAAVDATVVAGDTVEVTFVCGDKDRIELFNVGATVVEMVCKVLSYLTFRAFWLILHKIIFVF